MSRTRGSAEGREKNHSKAPRQDASVAELSIQAEGEWRWAQNGGRGWQANT